MKNERILVSRNKREGWYMGRVEHRHARVGRGDGISLRQWYYIIHTNKYGERTY